MLKPNYNNLWKLLIDKKIKKTQLKNDCKIAPGTMHKECTVSTKKGMVNENV